MRFPIAIFAMILAGCTCVEHPLQSGAEIGFNVELFSGIPGTKGAQRADESLVEDVNLYIFNSAGELLHHVYLLQNTLTVEDFLCFSKDRYSLYVLANWGGKLEAGSLDELKSIKYVPDDVHSINDGVPVMVGSMENVHLYDGARIGVGLLKMYACVNVKCNTGWLNYGVSVVVEKVSLKNVPAEVFLFGENAAESVVEGKVLVGNDLNTIKGDGVNFYLLENMQGAVPGAWNNKEKALRLSGQQRQCGSYVEMECSVKTEFHIGKMVYRFYLGSSPDNCDVPRNALQNVEVRFVGNASEDENSVSVDNSALMDRVRQVSVVPSIIAFAPGVGRTHKCRAVIKPESAYDKSVRWVTTNPKVVKVDKEGVVVTVGSGRCEVFAMSMDNPQIMGRLEVMVL